MDAQSQITLAELGFVLGFIYLWTKEKYEHWRDARDVRIRCEIEHQRYAPVFDEIMTVARRAWETEAEPEPMRLSRDKWLILWEMITPESIRGDNIRFLGVTILPPNS